MCGDRPRTLSLRRVFTAAAASRASTASREKNAIVFEHDADLAVGDPRRVVQLRPDLSWVFFALEFDCFGLTGFQRQDRIDERCGFFGPYAAPSAGPLEF